MNAKVEWFVWSSGREAWDPIVGDEMEAFWARQRQGRKLHLSHVKTWAGRDLEVYVDETGRFLGRLETSLA